nr:GvpL/GvpF family gas vesicle protein [Candidatus Chloroploca mongolica]
MRVDRYYLYAIAGLPEMALPDILGLAQGPLETVREGELLAIVSPIDRAELPVTREDVLRHETVIEALMAKRTVLPVRFGTIGSATRIRDRLAAGAQIYQDDLVRLAGKVELALRVMYREAPPEPEAPRATPAASDGRSYMLERLRETKREEHERAELTKMVTDVTADLAALAVQVEQKFLVSPRTLLKAAYLLDREGMDEARRCLATMREAHPELAFLATGPWPVYSFVRQLSD